MAQRKTTEKPRAELPPESGGLPETEAPMPTGSGVLGSRPPPDESGAGTGPEAAERRRFERTLKERS